MRKEDEQALRERIAYIHGRIERELEAFADNLNVPRVEFTQRLGALLLGIGSWHADRLSDLPRSRNYLETGESRPIVATVESAIEPHGSQPQRQRIEASVSASEADAREVKLERTGGRGKTSAIKNYWAKMSPLQRKREMARRQSLWSKAAQKKWRGKKAAKKTAKKATPKQAAPVEAAA